MADIIPSTVDGLKEIERLVLSLALKQFSVGEEVKVSDLARKSFDLNPVYPLEVQEAAIVRMAQNFVGTNNIPLFEPVGNFSNLHHGTLASLVDTTDLVVKINPITRLIFVEDDDLVAVHTQDGCSSCGNPPNSLLPIIPFIFVNGCDGTGSWLKSCIPKYKPKDIIANVRRGLEKKELVPMVPWFKGFKGKVEVSPVDNQLFIVRGVISQIDYKMMKVTISELPIGVSIHDYVNWLEGRQWLEHCKDLSDGKGTIHLEVAFWHDTWEADEERLMKKLELIKTISLTDMHVIQQLGEIEKFEDPLYIIEDFVAYRYQFYQNRKDFLLTNYNSKLIEIEDDIRSYTQHVYQCAQTVNLQMPRVEHFSGAAKLSDLFSSLNDKIKVINEVMSEVKVEDLVVALLEGFVSLKKSKTNGRKRCSRDDVLVLHTICNTLKQLKITFAKLRALSVRRDNIKKRLDELQKDNVISLWSKDLERLEHFLEGQCQQNEETQSKMKEAVAQISRGRKRKATC